MVYQCTVTIKHFDSYEITYVTLQNVLAALKKLPDKKFTEPDNYVQDFECDNETDSYLV